MAGGCSSSNTSCGSSFSGVSAASSAECSSSSSSRSPALLSSPSLSSAVAAALARPCNPRRSSPSSPSSLIPVPTDAIGLPPPPAPPAFLGAVDVSATANGGRADADDVPTRQAVLAVGRRASLWVVSPPQLLVLLPPLYGGYRSGHVGRADSAWPGAGCSGGSAAEVDCSGGSGGGGGSRGTGGVRRGEGGRAGGGGGIAGGRGWNIAGGIGASGDDSANGRTSTGGCE